MIDDLLQAITLNASYNATMVTLGADMLAAAAAMVGFFIFLQKKTLTSDAASHAALPGITIAFIVMAIITGNGKNITVLMCGAYLSSITGILLVNWIIDNTRLRQDAAICYVLSTFFALGLVLMTVIQNMAESGQTGIKSYLLGAAAGITYNETVIISAVAAIILLIMLVLKRSYLHLAFDKNHAQSIGIPTSLLQKLLTAIQVAVIAIGLKIVGVILIIAMMIIPVAVAWLWTKKANNMLLIAIIVGVASAHTGVAISNTSNHAPTGPMIVVVGFAIFMLSLIIVTIKKAIHRLNINKFNYRTN